MAYKDTILSESGLVNYYCFDDVDNIGKDSYGSNNGVLDVPSSLSLSSDATFNYLLANGGSVRINRSIQDDFSIEFWFSTTGNPSGSYFYQGWGLVNAEVGGVVDDFGTSLISSGTVSSGARDVANFNSTSGLNNGSWHHVVFSRVKTTGVMSLRIDGIECGPRTGTTNSLTSPTYIYIGRIATGGGYFLGKIANVALYNTVLTKLQIFNHYYAATGIQLYDMSITQIDWMEYASDAEAQAVYISNGITGGIDKYTTLFLPMGGSNGSQIFTDSSIYNFPITTYGNTQYSNAQSKFNSTSALFDGAGDYLKTTTACQLGSGDFTIDFWTYLLSRDHITPCLINNYSSYAAGSFAIFAGHNGGNTAKYQVAYNGATFPSIQTTADIIYNNWAHIAVVRSGSTITFYLNGTNVGQKTSATATLNGSGNCWIGTCGDYLDNGYIHGYIGPMRISVGIARWTSNFTPPSSLYDRTGNLQVYSESSIIDYGVYSLKSIASQTDSLNKTLTRTLVTPINLSGKNNFKGFIQSSRTGSNIKIGLHDSGGTTTEVTPNITSADTWQLFDLDISGVADANKDVIDQIIITIVNADADNIFYLDNLFAVTDPVFASSKIVGYAALSPIQPALNISKMVAYLSLEPYVAPPASSGRPFIFIF